MSALKIEGNRKFSVLFYLIKSFNHVHTQENILKSKNKFK